MAFKLSIEHGKGEGQSFDFDADVVTIGRTEEENDVVLFEPGVSRKHARILFSGGEYVLEDTDSAGGTLLNGVKIRKEPLSDGDTIVIGSVTFRFGTGAVPGAPPPASKKDSTRIGAPAPRAPPPSAPAPAPSKNKVQSARSAAVAVGQPVFNPKGVAIFVAVALLAAIGWAAMTSTTSNGPKKDKCPTDALRMTDIGADIFGTVADSVCRVDKQISFGFEGDERTRYLFYYTPFYTEKGEVKVYLNDKEIGESPLVSTRRSKRNEILISENDVLLKPKVNVISFRPEGKTEWGIERIELLPISLDKASAPAGEEEFQFAQKLREDKNVASANLYNAYVRFRHARQLWEGLPAPKPENYAQLPRLTEEVSTELDKLCQRQLFQAKQENTWGHFEKANDAFRFILAAFPGDEHPCRAQAIDRMGGPQRAMMLH